MKRVMKLAIIRNAIRCKKCGDIIESTSVHDFKFCSCGACAVDGGRMYLRRCGANTDWEDLSETTPDTDKTPICEKACQDADPSQEAGLLEAIQRIERMEELFNNVTALLETCQNPGSMPPEGRKMLQQLVDYQDSGSWLHDYELDEKGILPDTLKRGVLSEDGLYNLITEFQN